MTHDGKWRQFVRCWKKPPPARFSKVTELSINSLATRMIGRSCQLDTHS
jgi:hypothetical protein